MRPDETDIGKTGVTKVSWPTRAALPVATGLIVAGTPFLFMYEAGAGFDGLMETSFRLLLALPLLVAVAGVAAVMLMIVRAVLRRVVGVRHAAGWLLATGAIALALMVGIGWYLARPRVRLDQMAGTHAMTSISDVRAGAVTSFGDGQAWLFSFAVNDVEFARWVEGQGLEARSLPAEADDDDPWEVQPDNEIARSFPGLYRRPPGATLFYRDRLTVVASPDRSAVYVYVDRWRRMN